MDMDLWGTLLQWAGGLTILAAGGGVIMKGGRWMAGTWRKLNNFLDDWFGEPARPGRAAVPGVLARLEVLEEMSRQVVHEMTPNSGSSMKDAVDRMEAVVNSQAAAATDSTYTPPSSVAI